MSHNMIFTLYILTLSFAWTFIQVFAFKLIKNFRLHIFPMVLFTFNSIKFQVYNEDVSVGVVLVYSVLISGLACLTIHFEIERTKKKMVGEGGGSEVGLQVRGNVQTYEMMGNWGICYLSLRYKIISYRCELYIILNSYYFKLWRRGKNQESSTPRPTRDPA